MRSEPPFIVTTGAPLFPDVWPIEQPPGPGASQLAVLAQTMANAADRWVIAGNYEQAIQAHQAAATYALASLYAYAINI